MNPREFDHLLAQSLDAQAPTPDAGLAERIAAAVAADAARAALPLTRLRWRVWLQMPQVSRLAAAAGIVLAIAAASWLLLPGQPPAPPRPPSAPPDAAYARALVGRHAAAGPAAAPRLRSLAQLRPSAPPAPLSPRRRHAAALRHARLAQVTASRRHWPAVFPSPAPPSPQEQALLNFLATAPPRVVRAALTFPKPKWKWLALGGAQTSPAGRPAGGEHFLRSADKTEP
jgi:hypothetical protein